MVFFLGWPVIVVIVGIAAGLFLLPVVYGKLKIRESSYPKAELKKRIGAAVVDVGVCCILVWAAFYAGRFLFFFILLTVFYILIKDGLFNGKSIGKAVVGLAVIRLEDESLAGINDSLRRNFIFILPGVNIAAVIFEWFAIGRDKQGFRLGDKIAQTQVVNGKSCLESIAELIRYDMEEKERKKSMD